MESNEILKQCTIDNNIVRLPDIKLDRELYQEIAKKINLIGGKWKGGKVSGFVFNEDPTELLKHISNGEKRNIKKEYQFYATPEKIADILAEIAFPHVNFEIYGYFNGEEEPIDEFDNLEGTLIAVEDYKRAYLHRNSGWDKIQYRKIEDTKKEIKFTGKILEPSAGQGAIIKSIHKLLPDINVDYFEIMDLNRTFLKKIPNARFIGEDFLQLEVKEYYDTIIANPPFSKNQDIDHIKKMYECLSKGGRLVTIASKHWLTCNNKKETSFRNWIKEVQATMIPLNSDTFKESGANVSSVILVIDK